MAKLLPQSFYAPSALSVAQALLGQHIHCGDVVLRISEVEAYPPGDSASHCRMGRTPRNAPMWGPPGHAYVYLCYGVHSMLNFVTNADGEGAAVLIRACEPVHGLRTIQARRRGFTGSTLLDGPGKVAAALGLNPRDSGEALFRAGGLEVRAGEAPSAMLCGPRIGIQYASPADQRAKFRFAVAGSDWVSHPKSLRPFARDD